MHAGVMEKQKPHEAIEAHLEKKKEEKPKGPYAWERTADWVHYERCTQALSGLLNFAVCPWISMKFPTTFS